MAAEVLSADEKSRRRLLRNVTCEALTGASGVIFRYSKKKLNLSRAGGGEQERTAINRTSNSGKISTSQIDYHLSSQVKRMTLLY